MKKTIAAIILAGFINFTGIPALADIDMNQTPVKTVNYNDNKNTKAFSSELNLSIAVCLSISPVLPSILSVG